MILPRSHIPLDMAVKFEIAAVDGVAICSGIYARIEIGMYGIGRNIHHAHHPVITRFAHESHQAILSIVAYLHKTAAGIARCHGAFS